MFSIKATRSVSLLIIMVLFFKTIHIVIAFPKLYGEWALWHSTTSIPDNRVVVHIYPNQQLTLKYRFTKGPIVFNKSKIGVYKMATDNNNTSKQIVDVMFHHSEDVFLSVYGIGLQNFNIKTKTMKENRKYSFSMTTDGNNDIYLQSIARNDECFHIVRSVRINEPSIDIPISTFLFTQILGTIIGHIINQLLFHTN